MKKIRKITAIALLIIIFTCCFAGTAFAADIYGIGEDLNGLDGNGQYLGKDYRENYGLDSQKPNKTLHKINNGIFSFLRVLATLVVSLIYNALNFNIAELVATRLDTFMSGLHDTVFGSLFFIVFCGAAIGLIIKMAKNDMIGSITEIGKVIILLVLSMLITSNASGVLNATIEITSLTNNDILRSVNGDEEGSGDTEYSRSYAKTAAGTIWDMLIHTPWTFVEFNPSGLGDDSVDEETINSILKASPNDRQDVIDSYISTSGSKAFTEDNNVGRLLMILIYIPIFVVKSAIFIVIAMLQLLNQIIAMLFLLMTPVVFLMAMLPQFGFPLVSMWVNKILETQLSNILLTFLLVALIALEQWIFGFIATLGWYIVIIVQTAAFVGIIIGRKKILSLINAFARSVSAPEHIKKKMGDLNTMPALINGDSGIGNRHFDIDPIDNREPVKLPERFGGGSGGADKRTPPKRPSRRRAPRPAAVNPDISEQEDSGTVPPVETPAYTDDVPEDVRMSWYEEDEKMYRESQARKAQAGAATRAARKSRAEESPDNAELANNEYGAASGHIDLDDPYYDTEIPPVAQPGQDNLSDYDYETLNNMRQEPSYSEDASEGGYLSSVLRSDYEYVSSILRSDPGEPAEHMDNRSTYSETNEPLVNEDGVRYVKSPTPEQLRSFSKKPRRYVVRPGADTDVDADFPRAVARPDPADLTHTERRWTIRDEQYISPAEELRREREKVRSQKH